MDPETLDERDPEPTGGRRWSSPRGAGPRVVIAVGCPTDECGGRLRFDGGSSATRCPVCQRDFELQRGGVAALGDA